MDDSATILNPGPEAPAVSLAAEPAKSGPRTFPVASSPLHQAFESGRYPYARLMGRATYEAEKAKLQAELLKVQIWAQETGQKFVILMEGRDDQALHGASEPPLCPGLRADQALGCGKGPVVLPALHRASADGRGNGVL